MNQRQTNQIALLDRHVRVISGAEASHNERVLVSQLRGLPYLVFLGEPGIGKSTLLEAEATSSDTSTYKTRALINGERPPRADMLFVDALDEYRSDGARADKIQTLAKVIKEINPSGWRIACRSEDWRSELDIEAIESTTNGRAIVVVQVEPLVNAEMVKILQVLGEQQPWDFLEKAERLGADAFLKSPLSLKLLHKATVEDGKWPDNRTTLFQSAVNKLAYEHNRDLSYNSRPSSQKLLAEAEELCMLLSVTGSRSIWLSNAAPPSGQDARAYLDAQQTGKTPETLRQTLNTALFRGEGESFEPLHRSVSEFLAGRALARRVIGAQEHAALPLSRVLSLISGDDRSPVSETRGLYGWFATHLSVMGRHEDADVLIEADPLTVLLYGDAAVFSRNSKVKMLTEILWSVSNAGFRWGGTALGALADKDLVDDFRRILCDTDEDRVALVFHILSGGADLPQLYPLYYEIAVDSSRHRWERTRALRLWLRGHADEASGRQHLFELVSGEPASSDRAQIRLELLAGMSGPELVPEAVKSVIADYECNVEDRALGDLLPLQQLLVARPMPELFESPALSWRPENEHPIRSEDVSDLIDHALSAVIAQTELERPLETWRLVANAYKDDVMFGGETTSTVRRIIGGDLSKGVKLFHAIALSEQAEHPSRRRYGYEALTGRPLEDDLLDALVSQFASSEKSDVALLLIDAILPSFLAAHVNVDIFWRLHSLLRQWNEEARLDELSSCDYEDWRVKQRRYRLKAASDREAERLTHVEKLLPMLDELRVGAPQSGMNKAAADYFNTVAKDELGQGAERLANKSNDFIAATVIEGFVHTTKTLDDTSVLTAFGAVEANNQRHILDLPALAGLDWMLSNDALPDQPLPISLAVLTLRSLGYLHEPARRRAAEQWALNRLASDDDEASQALLLYWNSVIECGGSDLKGLDDIADEPGAKNIMCIVVRQLLGTTGPMTQHHLRMILGAAAKTLEPKELLQIVDDAMTTASEDSHRLLWATVGLSLEPTTRAEQYYTEFQNQNLVELFKNIPDLGLAFHPSQSSFDARLSIWSIAVRVLGPKFAPDDGMSGWVTDEHMANRSIRKGLATIGNVPSSKAGALLEGFLSDPALTEWHPEIQSTLVQQRAAARDHNFKHPTLDDVTQTLKNAAPANASDLQAVVIEVVERFQRELLTADNSPWKRYWNLDSHGRVTAPKVESACRDHLHERLLDRLAPYTVNAYPEAQRQNSTRADILVVSGRDSNIPIEIKRHWNDELWEAASTQLQRYTADIGARNRGIYLVLWFGVEAKALPPRSDGKAKPTSAVELQQLLQADLPPSVSHLTKVFVLDVSRPPVAP